jgi:hypothetical protein
VRKAPSKRLCKKLLFSWLLLLFDFMHSSTFGHHDLENPTIQHLHAQILCCFGRTKALFLGKLPLLDTHGICGVLINERTLQQQ